MDDSIRQNLIVAQNANTATATIVAAAIGANPDLTHEEIVQLFTDLHSVIYTNALEVVGAPAVAAAFPGSEVINGTGANVPAPNYPPAQTAPTAPAQADVVSQAEAFLRTYQGSNSFLLDVKGKTVDKGRRPSEGQARAVLKGERR